MFLLFVLMALMGGMTQAFADEHKNDGLARVIPITAKDGHRNEPEEAITKYHHYMAPKEPAFMDIMKKAMGEKEAQAFMADWGKTFESGQNQLLKYRPKSSDYGDK